MSDARKHTISILVENKPGVLQRVSALFTRRNFNIENISVGRTENPEVSRITIRTIGDKHVLEQITKQLNKLIEVIKVRELKPENTLRRELALIKVNTPDEQAKSEVIQYTEIFRGQIIDVTSKSLVIQITGKPSNIRELIKLFTPYGIKEISRTGVTAMTRGLKTL